MPDSTTPAAAPVPADAPEPPQTRGYFNQAQLNDIAEAATILAAARMADHAPALATEEIPPEYVTGLADLLRQARDKITETGQGGDAKQTATLRLTGKARILYTALQGIQSAAKQKKRMADEDDDPATTFSTAGYLIGARLNPSRELFIQNADALIAKAKADALPGYTAARIATVADALAAYEQSNEDRLGVIEDSAEDRIARDKLVKKINSRRYAIQNAADRAYPYWNDDFDPARRSFLLPLDRPFGG
jgi:hypothetical protein